MAVVGLKMVTLGLIDPDEWSRQLLTGSDGLSESGILQVDDTYLGSKTANITGLTGGFTIHHAENDIQFAVPAAGQTAVSLEINNLSFDILSKLIGYAKYGVGYLPPSSYPLSDEQPKVAMLIELPTYDKLNSVYFGFGEGYLIKPSQNGSTNTSSENMETDQLEYTALSCPDFANAAYKAYYSGDSGFDYQSMIAEVFPS